MITDHPDLVAWRRELHRCPEVGLHLPATQQFIQQRLEELGLTARLGSRCSSVTAVIEGSVQGPTVLLRADMDALPITEATGLSFASLDPAAMHACGHDLHMAALLGAAHRLVERRSELAGDVLLMFQPGEEGYGGARLMLEDGLLSAGRSPVVAAYGMHVFTDMVPRGVYCTRPGTLMASSASLVVQLNGIGGHGSAPHRALDPVPALAEMISALQTAATRRFDPLDPVIISIGVVRAGEARNIIPAAARFEATVRTFSAQAQQTAESEFTRVVRGVAEAHGLGVDVSFTAEYPPTVTDPAEARFALDVAESMFGSSRVEELNRPFTGSEDFAFVLDQIPGAFVTLGTTPANQNNPADNHSPEVIFDDGYLDESADYLAELAIRRLKGQTGELHEN